MLNFNNDNIFTGYLKQLLATFNLPKFKVYTKEQQKYHDEYIAHYLEHQAAIAELTEKLSQQYSWTTTTLEEEKSLREAIKEEQEKEHPDQEKINNLTLMLNEVVAIRVKSQAAEEKLRKEIRANKMPELNVLATIYRNYVPEYVGTTNPTFTDPSGETDPLLLPTATETVYPIRMRYIPYIKDNKIQEYAPKIIDGVPVYSNDDWKECHMDFGPEHKQIHVESKYNYSAIDRYIYNYKILNYTKNLKIQNNYYDRATHEYLGEYLRFLRDYRDFNLMPLYNCFGNVTCPRLNYSFVATKPLAASIIDGNAILGESVYNATFDTKDVRYKIYMLPVKLFKEYTLAIECNSQIELCCGIYDKYQDESEIFENIPKLTYECYNGLKFKNPILYSGVLKLTELTDMDNASELAQHEDKLKLFIKVPASNKSSIVVLEGNYTEYSNASFIKTDEIEFENSTIWKNFISKYPYFTKRINFLQKYLSKPFIDVCESPDDSVQAMKDKAQASLILSGKVDNRTGKQIIGSCWNQALKYYKYLNGEKVDEQFNRISCIDALPDTIVNQLADYLNWLYIANEGGVYKELKANLNTAHSNMRQVEVRASNRTVINFMGDLEEIAKKLITPLQLLRTNTGISYPFADRLIEYLTGNVITPYDDIIDNVARARAVVDKLIDGRIVKLEEEDGLWSTALQLIFYNYINVNYNVNDINHDILGFVDKDVEQDYSYNIINTTYKNGKKIVEKEVANISNANIYSDWPDGSEE